MKIKFLTYAAIAVASLTMLIACGGRSIYNQCHEIEERGWHMDSAVVFTPQIRDTLCRYNAIVTIRHTSDYDYQNFWMFLNITSPKGMTAKDSIECYLSDNKGRFLGSGISIYEMPVLISERVQFPESGEYKFEIIQGMRDTLLTGVRNICLSIEKAQ